MQPPLNRSRAKLKPADKFVLRQKTMLGRLDGLRGMTWAYAVLHHTGLSASTASKKFTPKEHVLFDKKGNPVISNIMYHYLNGKRPPTIGPRGKLGFDLVGAIDKDPLGSLATPWLTHPMWEILHPDIDIRQLREFLFRIPEDIRCFVFSYGTKDPMFGRISDSRKVLDELYTIGTIDAYAFSLAILRETELIGDRAMNEYAWVSLKMWEATIFNDPILYYVYSPLMHFLNTFIGSSKKRPSKELTEEQAHKLDQPRTWKRVGKFGMLAFADEDENDFPQ